VNPEQLSVARSAKDALRDDLISGVYHPRERLVEVELAERYGVNRSTVRAAIIDLTTDGLLERLPNRGARVRQYSIEEAIEEFQVRRLLQGLCAELAAEHGTVVEKNELTELLRVLESAVELNNHEGLYQANLALRAQIRSMSRHAAAAQILEQFELRRIQRVFPHFLPDRRVEALADQQAAVDAVVSGDAIRAREAEMHRVEGTIHALRALATLEHQPGGSSV
jgi:DNA-binding GntR family transcriptional regulator